MPVDHPATYRQPQADPRVLPCTVEAPEKFEDAFLGSRRDADAVIADGEDPLVADAARRNLNSRRLHTTKPYGVFTQIYQKLQQLRAVTPDLRQAAWTRIWPIRRSRPAHDCSSVSSPTSSASAAHSTKASAVFAFMETMPGNTVLPASPSSAQRRHRGAQYSNLECGSTGHCRSVQWAVLTTGPV